MEEKKRRSSTEEETQGAHGERKSVQIKEEATSSAEEREMIREINEKMEKFDAKME